MLETQKKNIDVREYLQIFSRRKFFVIIPFSLCLIAGIIISFFTKPVYESFAVIQVSQEQMLSRAMKDLVPGITPQEKLANLRTLITSHLYLRRLIQTLNLDQDPKMRGLAEDKKDNFPGLEINEIVEIFWINFLREHISIKQLGEEFIQIIAEGETADMVFNLVNTLTQIFIDEALRVEVGGIRGTLEFSSEQLAIYKKKLEESQDRLRRYKEEIANAEFENNAMVSANLDQINVVLTATDFDLKETRRRLQFLDSKIKQNVIYYKLPNNALLLRRKAQLSDAIIELSKLMLKYSWDDAKVLNINSEIDNLREEIKNEIEREIKSSDSFSNDKDVDLIVQKEVAAMDVEFLERKLQTLYDLSRQFKQSATRGPSREMALNRLESEVAANSQIYETLLQQTHGSEIEEALQKTAAEFKFRIVEPAIKPIKPIKQSQKRIIFMSFVLGIAIGFGLISILEVIDHSFKRVEAVEKYLSLPVLGIVPHIEMEVSNKNWVK